MMSNVEKEDGGEFLKLLKSEDEEEVAPLPSPFVTVLIKQEEAPPAPELCIDSEAPAPSDLEKETCETMNGEMREVEKDEYAEVVGVKDGRMELPNESESGGISSLEFQKEGVSVKEDSLYVVRQGDGEVKSVSLYDVSESQMEYVLEQVSAEKKILDVGRDNEDRPPPGWEANVVPDKEESVAPSLVGNIPFEIKMEEACQKGDKVAAPGLDNDDDDDGPPPGWDSTVTTDEVEAVTPALVGSIMLEIITEDVLPKKNTLPFPCFENDDDADGPPPGWEVMVIKDKVEPVHYASVESIQLETKMDEVRSTEDTLSATVLENNDSADRPPPGWEETVTKDDLKPVPPASVENIQFETKMEEVKPTEYALFAPGLENDDNADGPPPWWEATVIKDELKPVPHALVEINQMDIKTEEELPTKDKLSAPGLENDGDDDGPPPGWKAADIKESVVEEELVNLEKWKETAEHYQEEDQRPPGVVSEATGPPPSFPCEASSPTTEMGQVVCGSCRSLLSYPKGAKYVQCLCCQSVSLVLEAHQIGQVYCGSCSILLMYRFGSRAVKCSDCKFITQITPHNQRPPLSEQGVTLQSQLAQLRPRPSTNLAQ